MEDAAEASVTDAGFPEATAGAKDSSTSNVQESVQAMETETTAGTTSSLTDTEQDQNVAAKQTPPSDSSTPSVKTTRTVNTSITKEPDNNNKNNNNKQATGLTTIVEGSAKMSFPADQESTVFYNPVQVQNRDLSTLMIALAAERKAIRQQVEQKRQELRSSDQHRNIKDDELKQRLKEFESSLYRSVDKIKIEDGLAILDALAASGLRSMRYWKELPDSYVKHITINDLDGAAVERAHDNLRLNNLQDVLVPPAENDLHHHPSEDTDPRPYGIRIQHKDAMIEMYQSRMPTDPKIRRSEEAKMPPSSRTLLKPQWDVIDLDPYGSVAPFVDGAVQSIANGGLLCLTSTDMVALGGNQVYTCYGRYHALPVPQAGYLHEMSLRILLQTVATVAARYGRTIRPILSVGMDFYIRVFVEVFDDKPGVNELSLNIGHVYQSAQCASFHIVPLGQLGGKTGKQYQPGRAPKMLQCTESGSTFKVGGPIWLGPLHDQQILRQALQRLDPPTGVTHPVPDLKWIATRERLQGLLTSCQDEIDAPLFYKLPELARTLHSSCPPLLEFKAALVNGGYQASGFHKEPQAIKTNAPASFVWDVLRAWCKRRPPSKPPRPGSLAEKILSVEPSVDINFAVPSSLRHQRRVHHEVKRFPMNPEPNWGPKKRAVGHKRKEPPPPPSTSDDHASLSKQGGEGGPKLKEAEESGPSPN